MKITVGIIVLNGEFLLKQVLESVYPWAHAICIAEGPVRYFWEIEKHLTSTDKTLDIIKNFPDPQSKIRLTTGIYEEKDDQCRAWFKNVPTDTDYVLCVDADEIHTPENIELLVKYLHDNRPTSVGFKSDSFYGGFNRIIGGFEREHSFKRVLKYVPGCEYRTHRQPTLSINGKDIEGNDVHGNVLFDETGITMWHGSYLSPLAVYRKISYYEKAVISPGKCIPNYFKDVYLNWVENPQDRIYIEEKYNGVQEFIPEIRGESKTIPYPYFHPQVIIDSVDELQSKFKAELALCKLLSS